MSEPCILIYGVATEWEKYRSTRYHIKNQQPSLVVCRIICVISSFFPRVWVTTCLNWKLFERCSRLRFGFGFRLRFKEKAAACAYFFLSSSTFKCTRYKNGQTLISIIVAFDSEIVIDPLTLAKIIERNETKIQIAPKHEKRKISKQTSVINFHDDSMTAKIKEKVNEKMVFNLIRFSSPGFYLFSLFFLYF